MYSGVKWYFKGKKLINNSAIKIIPHSLFSRIFIESLQDENFGTYQCSGLMDKEFQYVYFVSASTLLPKSKK